MAASFRHLHSRPVNPWRRRPSGAAGWGPEGSELVTVAPASAGAPVSGSDLALASDRAAPSERLAPDLQRAPSSSHPRGYRGRHPCDPSPYSFLIGGERASMIGTLPTGCLIRNTTRSEARLVAAFAEGRNG